MADATYDVVIIGGGNKALGLACYLTKFGGLSVGVFEERYELGGGWSGEESPAPGFLSNICAYVQFPWNESIFEEDFPEAKEYGLRWVKPEVTTGVVFKEDDSCILQYHADIDPNQERTAKEIARFSERDAEMYLQYFDKFMKYIHPAVVESLWSLPVPPPDDPVSKAYMNPEAGMGPSWMEKAPREIFSEIFESPEMLATMAMMELRGSHLYDEPGTATELLLIFYTSMHMKYVVGGTHAKAHACQRIIFKNGGKTFTWSPVDKIIVENGSAKGIRLKDGTEIAARKAVVSTLSPRQLAFDLLELEHVGAEIRKKIANLVANQGTLTFYDFAFRESAQYKAAACNPDVDKALSVSLTTKDVDSVMAERHASLAGKWPDPLTTLEVSHGTLYEPTQTPLSHYPEGVTAYKTFVFVPTADTMTDQQWKYYEKFHAEQQIDFWQKYAPNMTWDNVIGYVPITPQYIANHVKNMAPTGCWSVIDNVPGQIGSSRPIPEWSHYRIPSVDKLYATGSGWPPFGAGGTWGSYVCYKVMAEDMGLRKPWEEKGRPY